jgi:hypothetical protein
MPARSIPRWQHPARTPNLQAANIAHPILGSSSSPRHNLVRGSWPGFDRRNQGALPRPSSLSQPGSHGSDEAAQSATSNQPIRSSSEGKGRHGDSAGYESPLTAAIFRILAPDPTMPWEESRPMGRWEGSRAPAPGWADCPDFTCHWLGGGVRAMFTRPPLQSHPGQHFGISGV